MRLWSLHPGHLDAKGLVALWREGLLARAVLGGRTAGYRQHPQLDRFRRAADPVAAIDRYLHAVADEADARGYRFDRTKLGPARRQRRLAQLAWERAPLNRRADGNARASRSGARAPGTRRSGGRPR